MMRPWAGTSADGLEIQHFGLQENLFQKIRRYRCASWRKPRQTGRRRPIPRRPRPRLRQFPFHPLGVGVGFVDLVDRHHQGDAGGPGVVDGLLGLFHDAVVRGHHQDHQVRDLGAPGPHGGKGFVARRVQEDHLALPTGQLT